MYLTNKRIYLVIYHQECNRQLLFAIIYWPKRVNQKLKVNGLTSIFIAIFTKFCDFLFDSLEYKALPK